MQSSASPRKADARKLSEGKRESEKEGGRGEAEGERSRRSERAGECCKEPKERKGSNEK